VATTTKHDKHAPIYICVCVWVCAWVCVCVWVFIRINMYVYPSDSGMSEEGGVGSKIGLEKVMIE
jgi:hypothetical protein